MINKFLNKLGFRIQRVPLSEEVLSSQVISKGKNIVRKISPEFKVLNGPFKGIKYPSLDITEAALVPKIVGSYESQLRDFVVEIINTPYLDIIDVGCAEGYYAVGLAASMPKSIIHGFDINEKDLLFCKKFAEFNNVNNITFNKTCDPDTLINFNFKSKGLVFCDTEGYEMTLFTPEVISSLYNSNVDVLVELHDVLQPGITSELILRFKETHDIRVVSTKDKRKEDWKGLENLSKDEKNFAVFEHRGGVNKDVYMEWAFFTKKVMNAG